MLKLFVGSLKLHKQTPVGLLICFLGFFLLGFGIVCGVLWDGGETTWGTLGAIFVTLCMVIVAFISFLSYRQDFVLALSLGITRKEFLVCYAAEQLLWVSISYLAVMLAAWVESLIYGALFPWAYGEFSLLPYMADLRLAVPVIVLLVIMPMFLGALYSHFGRWFGVVLYILWVGGCLLLPRVVGHLEEMDPGTRQAFQSVVRFFAQVPSLLWAGIGVAILAGMAAVTVVLGRKQMVQ